MYSLFGILLSVVAIARAQEEDERPRDIARSFNQRLQDFAAEDFVFDFRSIPVESMGIGGLLQPVDLANFPVVAMGNSAQSRFTLDPCGINLPHVHPRATEFAFVFKGSSLRIAFVHENGGGIFVNDITNDTSTIFPEGLIHYQQNTGCDTIQFMSTLNNADPGVVTITTNFFKLPVEGLAGSMDITPELATEIRDGLPLNIVRANEAQGQCQRTCGI
eukprot:Awhi_evm1s14694